MPSIKSALKYGYDTFKENWKLITLASLIVGAIQLVGNFGGHNKVLIVLLSSLSIIVGILAKIGYTKMFLRIYDGEKPEVMDIWNEYSLFWKFIGLSILTGIVVIVGFVALIIPGLILGVRLAFSSFIILDTNAGVIESMKESWNITKGSFWNLTTLFVVIGIINMIGAMAFVVGLFITIPITTLASIYTYRALSRAKAGLAVPPTTERETSSQMS